MTRVSENLKEVFAFGGLSVKDLAKCVFAGIEKNNCSVYSASLAYYFLFSLFPFLLFLVALLGFLPVSNLFDQMIVMMARVMPGDAHQVVRDYVQTVLSQPRGGLVSFGILFALWSASNAMAAVSDALNHAYGVTEGRPFWKVRGMAVLLTVGLSVFIIASIVLLIFGPQIGAYIASWIGLGEAFKLTWNILRWPVILALMIACLAAIYYFAPDVKQKWKWITPGSVVAVILWVAVSLGFSYYVNNFGSYDKTYGSIGAVIVLLTWMYASGFIILIGGVVNAEIEHASVAGKNPGEKVEGGGVTTGDQSSLNSSRPAQHRQVGPSGDGTKLYCALSRHPTVFKSRL